MNTFLKQALVLAALVAMTVTGLGQSTNKWEKSAALGLSLAKGNSDTLLVTADFQANKKWDKEEIKTGVNGSYGEDSDVKNNELLRGFAQWNHLFTERFYSYVRADALHDAIADVEYRVTLSPGVGYYFIKNEKTKLSGEAGPGVVFEKQGSTEKTYFTARLAERLDQKLNERARIWESVEFLPQIDDLNNFLINAEVGVEASLTEKLSLRLVAQDNYDREPAPGRKQNDIKLVTLLVLKF